MNAVGAILKHIDAACQSDAKVLILVHAMVNKLVMVYALMIL